MTISTSKMHIGTLQPGIDDLQFAVCRNLPSPIYSLDGVNLLQILEAEIIVGVLYRKGDTRQRRGVL